MSILAVVGKTIRRVSRALPDVVHARRGFWARKRREFQHDEKGNIVVFVVVSLPVFFLLATLAVDIGYLWSVQAQLRTAGDAAALVAVRHLDDQTKAEERAIEYATKNMPVAEHGEVLKAVDVVLGQWSVQSKSFNPGASPPDAVQVTVRRAKANDNPVDLFFAQYVGMGSPDVVVKAVASVKTGEGKYCVLSLEPSYADAFKTVGTTHVKLTGCGIAVNSSNASALRLVGQSEIRVEKAGVSVVGGIDQTGGATLESDFQPDIGIQPVADPFAGLQVPASSTCDSTDKKVTSDTTLYPGVYCGGLSMTSQAQVLLDPGIYIIKDGDFGIKGGANIRGDGVTIILTGSTASQIGSLAIAGHSVIELTAPTSGEFKGIQIFQDPNASSNGRNQIVGTSQGGSPTKLKVHGALYFPSQELFIAGDTLVEAEDGGCVTLVAREISMAGKGELNIECQNPLVAPVGTQRLGVRLRQ